MVETVDIDVLRMAVDDKTERTVVVQSSSGALAEPRDWLLGKMKEYQFSRDDVFSVHLALEEAFYNAMKHGNKMDPSQKIQMDFLVTSEKVEICISDSGSGFDPDSVPDCRIGENVYKAEGRGLLLMKSYMDEVNFNNNGNGVCMVRRRHKE